MPTPKLTFDYTAGGYLRNAVGSRYVFNTGKITVPIAGSPVYPATANTTQSVSWCSPFGFKILWFDLVRVGLQPRIPSPVSQDPNLEFMGGSLDTPAPIVMADGFSYLWQVSGVYYYRCLKPVWTNEGFVAGANAIDITPSQQNVFTRNQFYTQDTAPPAPPPALVAGLSIPSAANLFPPNLTEQEYRGDQSMRPCPPRR